MKTVSRTATIFFGLATLFAHDPAAEAAEIRYTCTHALKAVSLELVPLFERATGHKVVMRFDVVSGVKRQVEAGETFDIACLSPGMLDDLIKQGKIAPGIRADFARAGIGVAVRTGAPKPDIGSVEAFKRTLLNAKSVAHSREGQSGAYFMSMIDRLGIAEQLKPKLMATPPGRATATVASGEAEMVVVVVSTIIADSGVELVGLLPQELQQYSTFALGISAASKEMQAAAALIKYLTGPAAVPVLKSKGMEPG